MPPKVDPAKKKAATTAAKKSVKKGGGGEANVFMCKGTISTLPNDDMDYEEVGVVHVTKVAGIDVVKGIITQIANFVGSSGAEGAVFNDARNKVLVALMETIKDKPQKICGLRIDMEFRPDAVLVTGYGTLLQKTGA